MLSEDQFILIKAVIDRFWRRAFIDILWRLSEVKLTCGWRLLA